MALALAGIAAVYKRAAAWRRGAAAGIQRYALQHFSAYQSKGDRTAKLMTDRNLRKALIVIALTGLVLGIAAWFAGRDMLAGRIWAAGTVPVVVGLAVSMVRDLMAGRMRDQEVPECAAECWYAS